MWGQKSDQLLDHYLLTHVRMYRAALSLLVVVLLVGVGCNRKSSTPKNVSVSGQVGGAGVSGQAGISAGAGTSANLNTKVGVTVPSITPAPKPNPPSAPTAAPAPKPAPATPQNVAKAVINGQDLSEVQLNEFEETYGQRPEPGNYWYDGKSGLYGAVGYQAFGFMLPGQSYGRLSRTASNGNTGVFINGRELPVAEWLIWGQIVGAPIQPGSYWLDAQGNAGYEGSDIPLINLYLAAVASSYGGGGGGGDNFWSSRFSAGNYNADNSQGYVSVPGVGPVGYGF